MYVPQKDRLFGFLGMFSKKPVSRVGMEEAKNNRAVQGPPFAGKKRLHCRLFVHSGTFFPPPPQPSFFLSSCTHLSQSSA